MMTDQQARGMSASPPSMAELVNSLFERHRKANGEEYTYKEVAEALGVHPTFLYKIRSGKIPNPSRNTLMLLCRFFRVPASYFFPELEVFAPKDGTVPASSGGTAVDEASADEQIRLALRSAGLSSNAQAYIEGLIHELRRT